MQYGPKNIRLLLDTGASISAIFAECLTRNQKIDAKDTIRIKGVIGTTISNGTAQISLQANGIHISHKFVIIKAFDNDMNGVLGSDFFEKHAAKIDYETSMFTFVVGNKRVRLPMESQNNTVLHVPARCEFIHYFRVSEEQEYIVLPEQLGEGIFVAGLLTKPLSSSDRTIPVRILNVRDEPVTIKNFVPKITEAKNYHILTHSEQCQSVNRVEQVLNLVKNGHLNQEEKKCLEHIVAKFSDIFHLPDDPLTVTDVYKHSLQLEENVTPAYVKPYRLPHAQKTEIDKQINQMLNDNIIEPAQSAWSAPLLLVPKHADDNGTKKWRLVLDYRLLNKRLKDDKFPLANITEILDSLSGAMYFSHLDLSQGYYQVELDESSRPYTAFTSSKGQYQLTRLPMGLKVSPSAFSRAMTIAMSGLNFESCFVYLDDIIVFGRNLRHHNQNLVKVLSRLRDVNLKLNPSKCDFLRTHVLYLGHVISADGVSPDPEKIRVLQNYPVPHDSQSTKRFIAFANYYRSFIQNFAQIASPLNKLTRKNVTFDWTSECQQAFETLKSRLITPPVLQYPNFSENHTFILKTDASGTALGAVLCNEDHRPVAYASRALNKAEMGYCTIEKELLGMVFGITHFRPYLYAKRFILQNDHRPLVYLFGMTNPSSRLTKFRLILAEYDFTIEYIKGTSNVVADALSRIRIPVEDLRAMSNDVTSLNILTRAQSKQLLDENNVPTSGPPKDDDRTDHPGIVQILRKPQNVTELRVICFKDFDKLRSSQTQLTFYNENLVYDATLQIIYYKWNNSCSTSYLRKSLKDLQKLCTRINVSELVLIKNDAWPASNILKDLKDFNKYSNIKISILDKVQTINDIATRQLILNDFHMLPTGGHAGINRMYNNLKKYYFWTGLRKDVESFARRCDDCQRYKHSKPNTQPLTITSTASRTFQKIFLDLVGPIDMDTNGYKYILTIQCDLSKFVEAYPLANKEAETVAQSFVSNFLLRYGLPDEILTDQGTEFLSSIFSETCKLLGIKQLHSTAYHHETLGSLENSHKHLGAYLRIQCSKYANAWSTWIPYWCFSYNTSVHTETKYTPYELLFGRSAKLPSNIGSYVDPVYNFDNYPIELKYRLQQAQVDARSNLIASKLKRKEAYDQQGTTSNCYQPGDLVLVRHSGVNKMQELFRGPYSVVVENTPNVVILVDTKPVTVHKNRIKRYHQ